MHVVSMFGASPDLAVLLWHRAGVGIHICLQSVASVCGCDHTLQVCLVHAENKVASEALCSMLEMLFGRFRQVGSYKGIHT